MRRLTSFAIALAAAMSLSSSALAAGFFFDVVATTALTPTATDGASCPAPCYQVRVFADDSLTGGTTPIEAIQFDVAIEGATPVNLLRLEGQDPPAARNSAPGLVTMLSADTDVAPNLDLPWDLSATIAASDLAAFYAKFVLAADRVQYTADSIAAIRADLVTYTSCTPTSICAIQQAGLALDRIYLGRFNISGPISATTTFLVDNITGNGALAVGPSGVSGAHAPGAVALWLSELDGAGCSLANANPGAAVNTSAGSCLIDHSVPEPAAALLLGVTLAGLSFIRRRS